MKYVLNLAGGNIPPILDCSKESCFVVSVDLCYPVSYRYTSQEHLIAVMNDQYLSDTYAPPQFLKCDVYEFLSSTIIKFDHVCIYRFLEHVPKTNVLYFLYMVASCMKVGATLDVIVPDAQKLAKRLLEEDVFSADWEAEDLLTTYEFLSDQPSPHLSLWTHDRIKKIFEMEKFLAVINIEKNFLFDGRDIYLRSISKRIR
jgi:hypothetical protein